MFAGLLDRAPRVSRLAIVADGALFGVPFAALQRASGRYLLDDYTIEMAGGLRSVLDVPRRVRAESVSAIGDGHTPSAALPYLPQADKEAAEVAALYPRGRAFPGADASRTHVLQAFGTTDVLHFAGHSVANLEHPQYAYLLTGADPGDPDSGAVYAADLYRRSFASTPVVVLASCETAIGKPVFGEGPMSLAKPFLAGGARFVVASLWLVEDQAASAFALGFHRRLRDTGDPVTSLREAQLRMRQSADGALSVPRAWAAYSGYSGFGNPVSRKGCAMTTPDFRVRFVGRFVFACEGQVKHPSRVDALAMNMGYNADLHSDSHHTLLTVQRRHVSPRVSSFANHSAYAPSVAPDVDAELFVWDVSESDIDFQRVGRRRLLVRGVGRRPRPGQARRRRAASTGTWCSSRSARGRRSRRASGWPRVSSAPSSSRKANAFASIRWKKRRRRERRTRSCPTPSRSISRRRTGRRR